MIKYLPKLNLGVHYTRVNCNCNKQ